MEQKWFEMIEFRKRRFDSAVWIPLRANERVERGRFGHVGNQSQFFGVASLAIPLMERHAGENLNWGNLNLMHDHHGFTDGSRYVSADECEESDLKGDLRLVMSQRGNSEEPPTWHLQPDLVITLGLKREGNVWVAIDEDYIEVVRLKLDEDSNPILLEVRAEHLKDYLCARGMALRMSSYRERQEVVESDPDFRWPEPDETYNDGTRWEGRVDVIHEGGEWFGNSMAVLHITRPNLDFEEDVPTVGIEDDIASSSFTRKVSEARKVYRVVGEMWRDEWVEPGTTSTRIRGDKPDPPIAFIVDAAGKKEPSESLIESGRWLWFKPELIPALAERRGGSLEWYTRETGAVRGSPDGRVVFGINSLGLVNAYAKDVALLPEWLQRVWAGFNVGPEGKVSTELYQAQGQGIPARTKAPEPFLPIGISLLNDAFLKRFGFPLFRFHSTTAGLFKTCNRFKALSASGLYGLAKELVRVTLEPIETTRLHEVVSPPKGEKWGSLKSLENVLATVIGDKDAYAALGSLHGIYNLRIADAHIPSAELDDYFELAHVDRALPFVMQGRDLLIACVTCLHAIADVLR
jgi:hypothetical protein